MTSKTTSWVDFVAPVGEQVAKNRFDETLGPAAQAGRIPSPEENLRRLGTSAPEGNQTGTRPENPTVFDPARGVGNAMCSSTSISQRYRRRPQPGRPSRRS